MKALVLDKAGSHQELRVGDMPDPQPGEGEILVRVRAVGLNPVDYKLAVGGRPGWQWPHIPGVDAAGEIVAAGAGVDDFKRGDRVFYHADLERQGTFAQQHVTAAHTAARIPHGMAFEQAAALPCAGYTAWQCVYDRLHVREGMTVLVQAGAGGVGGFAIQLAKRKGATVFTTCSPQNFDYVKSLGADAAIDYTESDVGEEVRRLTNGRGVDAVLDAVSRASATASMKMLAFGGGLAFIAGRPEPDAVPGFTIAPSVHEVALGAVYAHGDRAAQARLAQIGTELAGLVLSGEVDPMIHSVLEFGEIVDGLDDLSGRHVRGKLVARVD